MDFEQMEVAENLVRMFPTVRTATVVDVVAHCVDRFPDDDPEPRAEVELSSRLIIAASESTTHLNQADIDALLGL